jgi:ribosome-binding factor A
MKKKTKSPEQSQRQLRVGENLKHIIADCLHRGYFTSSNIRDSASISVTQVRASPDLKNATAYVVVLGGADMKPLLAELNASAHVFQKEIGRQANMKFTPRIRFMRDDSFDNAQRIESLIREVNLNHDED